LCAQSAQSGHLSEYLQAIFITKVCIFREQEFAMQKYFVLPTLLIVMGAQGALADFTYGQQSADSKSPNYSIIQQGSNAIRVRNMPNYQESPRAHNYAAPTESRSKSKVSSGSGKIVIQNQTTTISTSDSFHESSFSELNTKSVESTDEQLKKHGFVVVGPVSQDRGNGNHQKSKKAEPAQSEFVKRPHFSRADLLNNCDSVLHSLINRLDSAADRANRGEMHYAASILAEGFAGFADGYITHRPSTTAALKMAARLSRDFIQEIENNARMDKDNEEFSQFYANFGRPKYNFMIKLMEVVTNINQAERNSMLDATLMKLSGADLLVDFMSSRPFMVNDFVHLLMAERFANEIGIFMDSAWDLKGLKDSVDDLFQIGRQASDYKRQDDRHGVKVVDRQISGVLKDLTKSAGFGR